MDKKDLAIAYRIYPGISKNPAAFPANKLLFSELCLRSFRRALAGLRVRIFALLDGCPPEYEALFRKYFRDDELEVVRFSPKIGNWGTFRKQIDILLDQKDAEAVYLAEDDYLYLPETIGKLLGFLGSAPDVHFITPYDHPDYYSLRLHRHREELRVAGDCHWRTAGTTCLTFLTTRKVLAETRRTFEHFSRGSADACVWLNLTRRGLFNPIRTIGCLVSDRQHFGIVAGAWRYGWFENIFGRTYKLWVPVPGIATQMEGSIIAPCHDWRSEIERAKRDMPADRGVP